MRKLLSACIAAALVVSGVSVIATADTGPNKTSWSFAFKPNKKNRSTSTDSVIEPAKVDDKGTADTSDDTYTAPKTTIIEFPAGSRFDTTVPPRCDQGPGEVAQDPKPCPKAKVGSGLADAVYAAPGEPKTGNAKSVIEAFNAKNAIYFKVTACTGGTNPCNPLTTFVLVGKLGYKDRKKTKPTLTVPTPKALLDLNIVITKFSLKTTNITKRRDGKIAAYTLTPGKCGGKWASGATVKYLDGTTGRITDTMPCS